MKDKFLKGKYPKFYRPTVKASWNITRFLIVNKDLKIFSCNISDFVISELNHYSMQDIAAYLKAGHIKETTREEAALL